MFPLLSKLHITDFKDQECKFKSMCCLYCYYTGW